MKVNMKVNNYEDILYPSERIISKEEREREALTRAIVYNNSITRERVENRKLFSKRLLKQAEMREPFGKQHDFYILKYNPGVHFIDFMNTLGKVQPISIYPPGPQVHPLHPLNPLNPVNPLNTQNTQNNRMIPKINAYHGASVISSSSSNTNTNSQQRDNKYNQCVAPNSTQKIYSIPSEDINKRISTSISISTLPINNMQSNHMIHRENTNTNLNSLTPNSLTPNLNYIRHPQSQIFKEGDSSPSISGISGGNNNNNNRDQTNTTPWFCENCGRGHPDVKKYARNQCQTCYKKTRKIFHHNNYNTGYPAVPQYASHMNMNMNMNIPGGYPGNIYTTGNILRERRERRERSPSPMPMIPILPSHGNVTHEGTHHVTPPPPIIISPLNSMHMRQRGFNSSPPAVRVWNGVCPDCFR